LSLALAGDLCEIISADSVQVYRYLDIGSGKPSAAQRSAVRHHLIDVVAPDYAFTAGDYLREARKASDDIGRNNRIPLFVGGTGLYIDSFFQGLSDIPPVSPETRSRLSSELEEHGLGHLYGELQACDPQFAGVIHPNDRQRILRGLEVYRETGKPLSGYFGAKKGMGTGQTLYIGLAMDRHELHRRIGHRVDGMMRNGFLDEVARLREMGYGPGLNSMKSIGYAELNRYLDGGLGLEEAVELIKTQTRRYAKRQMTWFGKNRQIQWFDFFEVEKIRNVMYGWSDTSENAAGERF